MVVAGELSGDAHAAALVAALRRQEPSLRFFGIGGEALRRQGVETFEDVSRMAVTGMTEVMRRMAFLSRTFHRSVQMAMARRPAAVILVDYPGFNLRLAKRLHAAGLNIIYYICPQIWAWHRSRISIIARTVNRLITIFPFEPGLFEGTGLRVHFAGNPLVDEAREILARAPVALPWQGQPRIAMLPGSRDHEIRLLLPPMWRAAGEIQRRHATASFLLASPTSEAAAFLREEIRKQDGGPDRWEVVEGATWEVLRQARAAWIASGTATVQASLMGCPMVIAYRVSPLTAWLARRLLRVPYLGMVNILAGREVCPERLQRRCTPGELAAALEPFLADGPDRAAVLEALDAVNRVLGPPGAADRAATWVLEELNS